MENKQDKGFTLVELLIVIVILGILATVTVFAVRGITDKGQENACNSDLKTLQTATEAYFAQHGGTEIPITGGAAVPASLATVLTANGESVGATAEETLVAADFMVDPSTNYDVDPAGVMSVENTECPAL